MAENLKLHMDSKPLLTSYEGFGLEEMGSQKISVVTDQPNGIHYNKEKKDSFVLDVVESFHHSTNKATTPDSRITRNLSRKGSQHGAQKKMNSSPTANDKVRNLSPATSSPRASLLGSGTPKMPVAVAVGSTDLANSEVHHQITITACNIISTTATAPTESRMNTRRSYSFRKSAPLWAIDPRKVLLFFATLSSMGTIILIYFTLSTRKLNADDYGLDWQQYRERNLMTS